MRVFAGLPLPESVRPQVATYLAALKQAAPGLNYVKSDGLHITIHFFGELTGLKVDKVLALMDNPALKLPAIASGVQQLGQFPPRGNPRVLFLELAAGSSEIVACQRIFNSLLRPAGFECEDASKPFVPHLTVARNKREHLGPEVLAGIPVPRLGFRFDKLVLFKSVLTSVGAEYSVLKTLHFI